MVSLFSLFGGKKKAKTPARTGGSGQGSSAASTTSTARRRSRSPNALGPSSAAAGSAAASTPIASRPPLNSSKSGSSSSGNKLNGLSSSAGNSGTAKFLSLRSRSSGGASTLLPKGRVGAQRTLAADSTADKSPAWELPSLGFGDDQGPGETGLGLENVGGVPKVSDTEWSFVQGSKLGMPEINLAWKLLGEGLRIAPDPTLVLSTTHSDPPSERYQALLCLLSLSLNPSILPSLPSLASHYPSKNATLASTWQARFADLLSTCTPAEQVDAAKWTLSHLDAAGAGAIIDIAYRQFAQAERNAGYPADAYAQYSAALTHADLHDVFQVWGDLAARALVESMLGGRVCLLWAWWFMRAQKQAKGETVKWEAVYEQWEEAGKRMQHLFYAWIRHQSVTQTLSLPTRLAQLVEGYPYGATGDRPAIPASSFNRSVLHIELVSESPIDTIRPDVLLRSAAAASTDEGVGAPVRDALRHQGDIDSLVEPDLPWDAEQDGEGHKSPIGGHLSLDDPSRSRSRSVHSPTPSTTTVGGGLGALQQEVGKMAGSHTPGLGRQSTVDRKASLAARSPDQPRQPVDWEDFTKSGFAEEDTSLNLSLSPSSSGAPQLPPIDMASPPRPTTKLGATDVPTISAVVGSESIKQVDDVFFAFVRDAQFTDAVRSWAPFTLVKLRTPFVTSTESHSGSGISIEGILVTISYRPPRPKTPSVHEDQETPTEAPSSPGQSSRSKFSTFGFRRQSMPGKGMMNLFGSTRSIPRLDEKARQDEARQNLVQRGRLGSVTEDPKVLSQEEVDEMGMIKRDSVPATTANPVTDESAGTPVPPPDHVPPPKVESLPTRTGDAVPAGLAKAPIALGPPLPAATTAEAKVGTSQKVAEKGLAGETAVEDWHYVAEGGAHAVFGYHGSNRDYTGKMLRLRKISTVTDHPKDEIMELWSKELLPIFVRPELLVETRPAELADGEWLRELLDRAEGHRPAHRVEQGGELNKTLSQDLDRPIKAWIMEDLRKAECDEGERVLTVEIKPKWGFLPDAANVHPSEAAAIKSTVGRFTLHQHYRGKTLTQYNPLDLYSGDDGRVESAIDGLMHDWVECGGKGNNLRVFMDGNAVTPSTDHTLAETIKSALIPALRESAVLELLRKLQSTLDSSDISSLARSFTEEFSDTAPFEPSCSVMAEITPGELRAFVDGYRANSAPQMPTLRERIIGYALSAIFKDGSVMIRSVIPADAQAGSKGMARTSTVKVLDLDLKPLKLQHWYELDDKLWKHWRDSKGSSPEPHENGDARNSIGHHPAVVSGTTAESQSLPAVAVISTAAPPVAPLSTKKSKFAGKLNLGGMSAPSAFAAPSASSDPSVPSTALAVTTPAVEMTLEDVLSLSPAKLRAKPGSKLAIEEEDTPMASKEVLVEHDTSDVPANLRPQQANGTHSKVKGHDGEVPAHGALNGEEADTVPKIEDLVIDSPVDRRIRSSAPSPSPVTVPESATLAQSRAAVIALPAIAAGSDRYEPSPPNTATSAATPRTDTSGSINAAPPTPTFGTAVELPGSRSPETDVVELDLAVSPTEKGSDESSEPRTHSGASDMSPEPVPERSPIHTAAQPHMNGTTGIEPRDNAALDVVTPSVAQDKLAEGKEDIEMDYAALSEGNVTLRSSPTAATALLQPHVDEDIVAPTTSHDKVDEALISGTKAEVELRLEQAVHHAVEEYGEKKGE